MLKKVAADFCYYHRRTLRKKRSTCVFPSINAHYKRITIIFLVLLIGAKIYAGDNFRLRFGAGDIGMGLNYSQNNFLLYEINASIINIAVEHIDTKIGFELSPLKYFVWSYDDDMIINNKNISFLNIKSYWNMLQKNTLVFGPFFSINYFFYNDWNNMNYNAFIFNTGLSFSYSIKMNNRDIYYNLFCSEIGYRNISGSNYFYFNIKVDLGIAFTVCAYQFSK
jgi:hypothetical protein